MRAMTPEGFNAKQWIGGAVLAAVVALAPAVPAGAADLSVILTRSPGGAVLYQPTGPVTLTALYTGPGTGIEYQFWYQVKDAGQNYVWFLACDWNTSTTCLLNGGLDLTTTGKYTFQAYARRPTSTSYDGYAAGDHADVVTPTTPSGNYPTDWIPYPRMQVYFGWAGPQDMTDVIGYDIEIDNKDDGDAVPHQHLTVNGANVFSVTATLEAGYSYRWWVRTRLGAGGNGPYSPEKNFAIAVPRPGAPATNAFITAPTATFNWSPVTPGNGYELTLYNLNTATVQTSAQIPGNMTLSQSLPLTPDTDYQWYVKATGIDGAGISTPITFYSGPTKVGIANVSNPGTVTGGTSYAVTWTSRSVPAVAVADIWFYRASTRQWVVLNASVPANNDTFLVTIPSTPGLSNLWVGACHPTQVSGGRCSAYPYGAAISANFIVSP